jgi:hypothetical protein
MLAWAIACLRVTGGGFDARSRAPHGCWKYAASACSSLAASVSPRAALACWFAHSMRSLGGAAALSRLRLMRGSLAARVGEGFFGFGSQPLAGLERLAEPTVPRCGSRGGSCSGGCCRAGVFSSQLIARRTAAARSGVALLRVAFTSVLSWAFFLAASLRADWANRNSCLQKIDFPIAACGFLSRGVRCLTGGSSSSDEGR